MRERIVRDVGKLLRSRFLSGVHIASVSRYPDADLNEGRRARSARDRSSLEEGNQKATVGGWPEDQTCVR